MPIWLRPSSLLPSTGSGSGPNLQARRSNQTCKRVTIAIIPRVIGRKAAAHNQYLFQALKGRKNCGARRLLAPKAWPSKSTRRVGYGIPTHRDNDRVISMRTTHLLSQAVSYQVDHPTLLWSYWSSRRFLRPRLLAAIWRSRAASLAATSRRLPQR
jgi:hypothetical protein